MCPRLLCNAVVLAGMLLTTGCSQPMLPQWDELQPEALMAERSPAIAHTRAHHTRLGHRAARAAAIIGSYGTYANPPRVPDKKKNLEQLVDELVDLNVNTYDYLIYHDRTDWEDLKTFLPMAARKNIMVWVTVMPPSGSYPHRSKYSEPFRLDFVRWAVEIATLSQRHPNLVAWSIDDFSSDLAFFTPGYVTEIRRAAARINPRLAFVPVVYYRAGVEEFKPYVGLVDGILFPYRAESRKPYNVTDAGRLPAEMRHLRQALGPTLPIVLFVYASRLGNLAEATPQYVRQVMVEGHALADGVHVFRHPPAESEKYRIEKELFARWRGAREMGGSAVQNGPR